MPHFLQQYYILLLIIFNCRLIFFLYREYWILLIFMLLDQLRFLNIYVEFSRHCVTFYQYFIFNCRLVYFYNSFLNNFWRLFIHSGLYFYYHFHDLDELRFPIIYVGFLPRCCILSIFNLNIRLYFFIQK